MLKALNDVHNDFSPVNELRILFVQEDLIPERAIKPQNVKSAFHSVHNSFVVLPSSEGTVNSRTPLRIQSGNADEVEESKRREEVNERKAAFESRKRAKDSEHDGDSLEYSYWSDYASDGVFSESSDGSFSDEEHWVYQEGRDGASARTLIVSGRIILIRLVFNSCRNQQIGSITWHSTRGCLTERRP